MGSLLKFILVASDIKNVVESFLVLRTGSSKVMSGFEYEINFNCL